MVTNGSAVGGLHADWSPADLMVATDHLNFIRRRGLLTPDEIRARGESRRVTHAHDPELRQRLQAAAVRAKIPLRRGVLMGSHGPSYETAAEVRMAAKLGADVVCMSTVHEVTVVRMICRRGVCVGHAPLTMRFWGLRGSTRPMMCGQQNDVGTAA